MRRNIILLIIILSILISGCIENPFRQVPIIKINMTFIEKDGIAEVVNYDITQESVSYLARPVREHAPFPAISARAMIVKGKNSSIGPWEMLPYSGPGTYTLNVSFEKNPLVNDSIHISVYVLDKDGERMGAFKDNIVWR